MLILAICLVMQPSPFESAIIGCGNKEYSEREKCQKLIVWYLENHPEDLREIRKGIYSSDAEIRWRCLRAIQKVHPCYICPGTGATFQSGNYWDQCKACVGFGIRPEAAIVIFDEVGIALAMSVL